MGINLKGKSNICLNVFLLKSTKFSAQINIFMECHILVLLFRKSENKLTVNFFIQSLTNTMITDL